MCDHDINQKAMLYWANNQESPDKWWGAVGTFRTTKAFCRNCNTLHSVHLNTRKTPFTVCKIINALTFRLPFVVKALPQIEQAKGFSPVCVRSWICRALAEEKFFPHEWQLCCLGVRRGGGGANMGLRLGLMVVWGAAAGTWIPTGRWELSLRDIDFPCPFISILIMFDAVLAKLGVLSPEKGEVKLVLEWWH